MSSSAADVVRARAVVPASVPQVADLFWDVRGWHRIWNKIDEVAVLFDDGIHQEFRMMVQRDGRAEDVRTVRYRQPNGDVAFFSPAPPPAMTIHTGSWSFRDVSGGCEVTAVREYRLRPGPQETAAELAASRAAYAQAFTGRLQAILDAFVAHYRAIGSAPVAA